MAAVEVYLHDPTQHSKAVRVAAYYMYAELFAVVTWTARISILYTMIRLASGKLRSVLLYTSIAFGVTWAILFAQILWVCEKEPGWKDQPRPSCVLGKDVVIAQEITDVLCDAILILIPIKLIWRAKLSRAQMIRVSAIFSTTIISTAVSLNHAYTVLKKPGLDEDLAGIIQYTVSLMVANFSVIIAFLFRITTEPSSITDSTGNNARSRSIQFPTRIRAPNSDSARLGINTETGSIVTSTLVSGGGRAYKVTSHFDMVKMVKVGGDEDHHTMDEICASDAHSDALVTDIIKN